MKHIHILRRTRFIHGGTGGRARAIARFLDWLVLSLAEVTEVRSMNMVAARLKRVIGSLRNGRERNRNI